MEPMFRAWQRCIILQNSIERLRSDNFSKNVFGFAAESSISPFARSAVDTSTESHYCRRSQITAVFLAKFS